MVETCDRLRKWADIVDLARLRLPDSVALRFAARRRLLADTRLAPAALESRRFVRLRFLEDAALLHVVVQPIVDILCLSSSACAPSQGAQLTPGHYAAEALQVCMMLSYGTRMTRVRPPPPPSTPPISGRATRGAHRVLLALLCLLVAQRDDETSG
jgi:hypothetical protein